ncbi:MAG: TldD/PmbA family protein [Nitrospirae bacterium]|nr:TldD/PmbA family protein [Nitrospirota bacterium]
MSEKEFAEIIINRALIKGADEAEIYIKLSKNLSIEVKDQKIDAIESSHGIGYSLRILKGKKLGFSYSTDRSEIESVVDKAIEAAKCVDADEYLELPTPNEETKVEIFDPKIGLIKDEEAIKRVLILEKSAYDEDSRIKNIRKARGSFSKTEVIIKNSNGIDNQYLATTCTAQIMVMAENGNDKQMGWYFSGSRFLSEVSFENVGREASRRALQLLGSKRMNPQKAKILLDSLISTEFLGIFASLLSSENVQKGKSLLINKLGKTVISPKVNIIDNGILQGKIGSSPVDDEGVSCKEKTLIKEGVLLGYLYNTYTARKDGVSSTGNAVRRRFSCLPSVGISNMYIEAVSKDYIIPLEDIFKSVDRCLYVTEAMGVHTANPVSGEFSVGVSGIWIENGEVAFPVNEAVISGNILSFFGNIEAVGDDLRFFGNIGSPSILFGPTDISA